MLFLPPEVQLDVLKYLNFEELFSFKQTNFYFRNLIEKFEGGLAARMKFLELSLINSIGINSQKSDSFVIIKHEPVVSDFVLNEYLTEKWETAMAKPIPLFLHRTGNDSEDFAVQLEKAENKKIRYILKLPNFPKSIEEMIIIRFWLEQLFNCAFKEADFRNIIFNLTMINLLFDNLKQFHIKRLHLSSSNDNNTIENILKFGLSHFAIYESLVSTFQDDISEQQTNILFNIIKNEGKKLPKVVFVFEKFAKLYDVVIEYMTTSKDDFSKMVPVITLGGILSPNFKLNKRAENIEYTQADNTKITKYQIANIYNPKARFSFRHEVLNKPIGDGSVFIVKIEKWKSRIRKDEKLVI
uniref:F-box domain-containing protein n=1 Tax=Meloidogyne enterolobii TaxID=390850 RepID=A0A6V7TX05_MELEN|nr:unnamed protein product [Meloidogyne enterolobii]